MNCIAWRTLPAFLFCASLLLIGAAVQAQDASVSRPAITVLDSTKDQDGLVGSVRRVKTETAKIELKEGRPIEGPAQLVELTTYGVRGNRIENTSYPTAASLVGKEEYKYDERGNITEMTARDDRGSILSREAYTYEFDKLGNWTKMVTNLVVFENGQLKREPVEVTYRTVTYYYDDTVAKIVDQPRVSTAPALPEPGSLEVHTPEVLEVERHTSSGSVSVTLAGEPPPLLKPSQPEGVASAFAARKENESAKSVSLVAKEKPAAEKPAATEITNNPDQKRAFDLYVSGKNSFESGDAPGAIESYLQSIKLEPGSAEVHLNLGHAYLQLKKDRDAVNAFKQSIKLNPNVAEAHYGSGFVNFRLGRFRDAADAFKKATTLEPRMAKAHYGLSLAYQELGNNTGLLEEYRILERLDRNLAKRLVQTFPQFNFSCRLMQGCP